MENGAHPIASELQRDNRASASSASVPVSTSSVAPAAAVGARGQAPAAGVDRENRSQRPPNPPGQGDVTSPTELTSIVSGLSAALESAQANVKALRLDVWPCTDDHDVKKTEFVHATKPRISCQCVDCTWSCKHRCSCIRCKEARLPAILGGQIDPKTCFCADYLAHLEELDALDDLDRINIAAEGELEQGLASVAYALHLASLLFDSNLKDEARVLYQRFLGALDLHILGGKRREELELQLRLQGDTHASVLQHARKFAVLCRGYNAFGCISAVQTLSLNVLKLCVVCCNFKDRDDESVATVLWDMVHSCIQLDKHVEAWKYLRMAVQRDRDSGDERRLASRCCSPAHLGPNMRCLANMFGDKGIHAEEEKILQLNLEIAERSCQDCQKRNAVGNALFWLGELVFKAGMGSERAESYLKTVQRNKSLRRCRIMSSPRI
eukprot:tig00021037_g17456.t2